MTPIKTVKMIDLSVKPIPIYYGIEWFWTDYVFHDYWNQRIKANLHDPGSMQELLKFLEL